MKNTYYHQNREKNRNINYLLDSEPSRVVMILTNKCNLSCSFCFQDRKTLPKAMTSNDWIKVIDSLKPGTHITLTGGEPILFKDFKNVFIKATLKNPVNIITNGVLINKEIIDLLLSAKNFQVISISIDTIGNINRNVKKDQYQKMVDTMNYFKIKRDKIGHQSIFDTKTVVTNLNSKDLFQIYLHCKQDLQSDTHSFQFLKGSPIQHSDKMFDIRKIFDAPNPEFYDNIEILADQLNKIREYVLLKKTQCYSHPNFINFFDFNQNYHKILSEEYNDLKFIKDKYEKCKGPWESAHINADGNVFPCLAVSLGNIKDNTLEDIYKSKDAINFRSIIREQGTVPACHRCGYLKKKLI